MEQHDFSGSVQAVTWKIPPQTKEEALERLCQSPALYRSYRRMNSSWKEVSIGIPDRSCIVAGATLLLLLVYEHFMARGDVLQRLERQPAALRWALYYLFVFVLFAYGKFGTENFIYLQF